jgi:hypothetical protein
MKNPIGGGKIQVTLETSMRGGGHYLLCPNRGLASLVLPSSKGLGLDIPKYLGPLIVGRKITLKLYNEREIK